MNIIELIRSRVEAIRSSTGQTPIEIVNQIIQSTDEKGQLITTGPFLGIEINEPLLSRALITYRTELQRVVAMEDGIFRHRGIENGYTLSENEDTCWGTYYNRLIHQDRNREDLRRIIDECNVLVQQFLPQPAQNADRRGLVIGQVQSGKTTIFNGVISAAADMGFNLIIVLSGTLESLRTQTQKRIMKDVTTPWAAKSNTPFYFTWISHPDDPGLATASRQASHVLTDLSNQGRRQVAIGVFLKNASVLTNLRGFLNTISRADQPNIRALVIDDEADQATPNAGVNRHTITAINRGIKLLIIPTPQNSCPTQGRASYLGFTATPFANLLNEAGDETLYPKDFLYFLRSSERYFGPWQLFGNPDEVEGEETIIPLDLIRILSDEDIDATVPQTGRPRPTYRPAVTPGLRKAIRWYSIAASARRVTDPESWSTMLIHTSSKTSDHQALFGVVSTFCNDLLFDWSENRQEWRTLWDEETQRVSLGNFSEAFPRYGVPAPVEYPEWNQLEELMEQVIRDIRIKIDNSLFGGPERLRYSDEAPSSDKLQIAIGGNTLSRGLTLEGLVSSYFARRFTPQSAYDTLLQMGRWFGFRQGYELLSRLWTTEYLRNAFRDLVIMEVNLRKSMQLYLQGLSPARKAPVITRMPTMAITRKSVMGNTAIVEADYSGAAPQTISFVNEQEWLQNNLAITLELLQHIEQYIVTPLPDQRRLIYNDVPVSLIIEFIRNFNFWPMTNTFNKRHMLDFIERNDNLYKYWSIVVMGGTGTRTRTFGAGEYTVKMINRSRIKGPDEIISRLPIDINLKSLRATRDLLSDRSDLFTEGLKETEIWGIRRANQLNPILIIYPIDRNSIYNPPPNTASTNYRVDLNAVEDIIGISLVMNPPGGQQGAIGVSLNLEDVYTNDEEADSNPDLPDPLS